MTLLEAYQDALAKLDGLGLPVYPDGSLVVGSDGGLSTVGDGETEPQILAVNLISDTPTSRWGATRYSVQRLQVTALAQTNLDCLFLMAEAVTSLAGWEPLALRHLRGTGGYRAVSRDFRMTH